MEAVDIAVIGGGPVGLALVAGLAGSGRPLALIEPQDRAVLAAPPDDGREIALTHASRERLSRLGLWEYLPAGQIWPLEQASVRDRGLPFALDVAGSTGDQAGPLGWMVSNAAIRQAAWRSAQTNGEAVFHTGAALKTVSRQGRQWRLVLDDGRTLLADAVVAADSRFSSTRRLLGVGARSHDHGMAMVVRRVALEKDHHGIAWQWFGDGMTRALLPLGPRTASAVLTLPMDRAKAVLAMDDLAYGRQVSTWFEHRWGGMRPLTAPHMYPMVTVLADRFSGPGFALAGDAAVGMHPVTAHGFNLGVRSASILADVLARHASGAARDAALLAYAKGHRREAVPLFAATGLVASLYTDMRLPARIARGGALALASALPPFSAMLRRHLTQRG